jgi:autophagy-related protein 16-1
VLLSVYLPGGQATTVDASPMDAKLVASGGADRCVRLWDLGRGICRQTIMCHSSCNSLAITMDGNLIVSGHFDGMLRFWDVRKAKIFHEVSGLHGQQITSVSAGLLGGAHGVTETKNVAARPWVSACLPIDKILMN